jgi:hypothetical protein
MERGAAEEEHRYGMRVRAYGGFAFYCGSIATRPEIDPSSAEIVPGPMHLAGIIGIWSGIVSAFV